jgi:molybdopterin converting factor small subunit
MSIRVEFYGIPRSRAGVEFTMVEIAQDGIQLGDLLGNLSRRFPDLAECIEAGQLKPGYRASVDGDRFVSSNDETLAAGSCLLIMSADAGG